jgi:predicted NUDIX family phosphoesterase
MPDDIESAVLKLDKKGEAVRSLLEFAQRAFVIEFAGTPKSGKSTSVEAIRHFFAREGFRVHVLTERAALCPIPMKGHLFFNTWCAASMLAELLANVETETDIIIIDRGLFDALVWLQLQRQRGELTTSEANTIESFLLLDRWRSLIDLVVVMNVSAEEAMERETSQRITRRPGSIMNVSVLSTLSASVHESVARYEKHFDKVILHETAGRDVRASNIALAEKVLAALEEFLNPEILVVPRKEIDALPLKQGGSFSVESVNLALDCISQHGMYMRRSEAERDNRYVQIIAAGMLTYQDQVFIFQRKEQDPKYRLYGRTTIFQAAHTASKAGKSGRDLMMYALQDRITKSLFLSRTFRLEPVGYCWDRDDAASSRHLGIVFRVEIDNEHTARDLKRKELKKQRGPSLAGSFVGWTELSDKKKRTKFGALVAYYSAKFKQVRGLNAQ